MPYTVIKSLSIDFGGNINTDAFTITIENDPAITTPLEGITISGDVVSIIFTATPSAPELAALDALIAAYIYIPYNFVNELAILATTNPTQSDDNLHGYNKGARWINTTTKREFACVSNTTAEAVWKDIADKGYDAIVDISGNGDFTSIAEAFASGAISVYIRAGTYVEVSDIIIPDKGVLVGEGPARPIIFFALGHSIICDGIGAGTIHNNGTISITNGTSAVTGVGTTFTAANTGEYILIGQSYYEIFTITDDTNLTIIDTYRGKSLTSVTYEIHTLYSGILAKNFVFMNSTTNGFLLRGVRQAILDQLAGSTCATTLRMDDVSDSSIAHVLSDNTSGPGFIVYDSYAMGLNNMTASNSATHGFVIDDESRCVRIASCESSNNTGNGFYITDVASDIIISGCIIKNNAASGVYADTNTTMCFVSNSVVRHNGSHGINLVGIENTIQGNIISGNNGYGILSSAQNIIATNHCDNNTLSGISITGNSSQIVGNTSTGNGDHGIAGAGSYNIITGNTIDTNTNDGIRVEGGSANNVTSNRVANNGTIGINILNTASLSQISTNNVVGHTTGIYAGPSTSSTIIGNNVVSNASGNGITCASNNSIITANRCSGNTGYGIEISGGTTNTIAIADQLEGNTAGTILDNGTITSVVPINGSYIARSDIFAANGMTNIATYSRVSDYIYPGITNNLAPKTFLVSAYMDAGATSYDVRIYDQTNGLTVAESLGNTNTAKALINLGAISNIPASAAIFEIQIRVTTASNFCYLTGLIAKYY